MNTKSKKKKKFILQNTKGTKKNFVHPFDNENLIFL